jgi:hypothetical protein
MSKKSKKSKAKTKAKIDLLERLQVQLRPRQLEAYNLNKEVITAKYKEVAKQICKQLKIIPHKEVEAINWKRSVLVAIVSEYIEAYQKRYTIEDFEVDVLQIATKVGKQYGFDVSTARKELADFADLLEQIKVKRKMLKTVLFHSFAQNMGLELPVGISMQEVATCFGIDTVDSIKYKSTKATKATAQLATYDFEYQQKIWADFLTKATKAIQLPQKNIHSTKVYAQLFDVMT